MNVDTFFQTDDQSLQETDELLSEEEEEKGFEPYQSIEFNSEDGIRKRIRTDF